MKCRGQGRQGVHSDREETLTIAGFWTVVPLAKDDNARQYNSNDKKCFMVKCVDSSWIGHFPGGSKIKPNVEKGQRTGKSGAVYTARPAAL